MPGQNHPLPKSCAKTENQNDICRAAGLQDQSMRNRSIVQEPEEGGADCKGALEDPWLKILNNKKGSKKINLETLEIPKSRKITRFLEESQDIDANYWSCLLQNIFIILRFQIHGLQSGMFSYPKDLKVSPNARPKGRSHMPARRPNPVADPKIPTAMWENGMNGPAVVRYVAKAGTRECVACKEWTWGVGFGAMMQCVFSPFFVSGLYILTWCYDVKSIVHLCMDTYIYILEIFSIRVRCISSIQ